MNESNLMELLLNNSIKPKAKSMEIALHLSEGKLHPETIVGLLGKASFSQIARLLESVELASKTHPGLVSPTLFDKAIDLLLSSEPAV
ncbi:MAG: hypothetical protein ACKO0X_06850, partial [Bacteroidota bacterium]